MHDVLFKILKKCVSLQHLYFVTPCDYIINGNQYIRVYLPPPYTAPPGVSAMSVFVSVKVFQFGWYVYK